MNDLLVSSFLKVANLIRVPFPELINCVDSKVVLVLRTIMVLLFLSSLFSSLQAFFDLLGARRSFFKAFQLYAIGSVTTGKA